MPSEEVEYRVVDGRRVLLVVREGAREVVEATPGRAEAEVVDREDDEAVPAVDLVAFIDVINVYGGPGSNSQEFDPRRGINIVEENEAFPIIGIIFERTW